MISVLMKIKGVKSQANIISILLIILIIFVAVVIVWNLVYPMVREQSEEIDISPLNINIEIEEVVVFVGGSSKISIRRGSGDGKLSGLMFIFYDSQGLNHIDTIKENLPGILESKTYYFRPPKNIGKIQSVSVAPVVDENIGREFKSDAKKVFEIPRGLVSWWRFEDEKDFVGGNNGQLNNVVIESGNLVLDGSGFFNTGNNEGLNMDEEIGISVWVFPQSAGSIIKKGDVNKNYELLINNEREIVFNYKESDFIKSYVKVKNEEWNHILVSVDWDGLYKIYINGEPGSYFETRTSNPSINQEDVVIGQNFKGKIDEVMIFNRSLTSDNAEYLYNSIGYD